MSKKVDRQAPCQPEPAYCSSEMWESRLRSVPAHTFSKQELKELRGILGERVTEEFLVELADGIRHCRALQMDPPEHRYFCSYGRWPPHPPKGTDPASIEAHEGAWTKLQADLRAVGESLELIACLPAHLTMSAARETIGRALAESPLDENGAPIGGIPAAEDGAVWLERLKGNLKLLDQVLTVNLEALHLTSGPAPPEHKLLLERCVANLLTSIGVKITTYTRGTFPKVLALALRAATGERLPFEPKQEVTRARAYVRDFYRVGC